MNLPNKLTIFRVCLVPLFLIFLLWDFGGMTHNVISAIIFIIASATDMLDGYIARKCNMITNFGKFMDPLADKLLVDSALIALTAIGRINCWIVIVIIAREFIISGFRLVASDAGIVIAASWWGKIKTVFQMAATILLIFDFPLPFFWWITQILVYIALILTIVSLVDYIVKNKKVLSDIK